MAYVRPIVMVFQEYAKMSIPTQTAILTPCIVGPCYHIMDPEKEEILAFAGTYTEAGIVNKRFPNNAPGALIDESTVRFRFKNPIAKLTATNVAVGSFDKNTILFNNFGL